jgi:hypothetical protein
MLPELTPVKSSNIAAVGHQGDTLFVKFKSGPTWKYMGVNTATHTEMMAAESIGSYFSKHIKNNHPAERISDGT